MSEMPSSNRTRYIVAVGFMLTVGLAATSGAVSAPATGSRLAADAAQGKSKIAFQSFRDGQFEAYVMNTDGSGQQRLTTKPNVFFPVWSPDGRRVAFPSVDRQPFDGGNFDLYVMNANGSGLRRLTHDPASDVFPVWSPDGRKIAFTRSHAPTEGRGPGEFDVYVINVDGSGERNLTGDAMKRRTRVVARRTEDRLYERARRLRPVGQLHLRHERGRERAAEADAPRGLHSGVVTRRAEDRVHARCRPG